MTNDCMIFILADLVSQLRGKSLEKILNFIIVCKITKCNAKNQIARCFFFRFFLNFAICFINFRESNGKFDKTFKK